MHVFIGEAARAQQQFEPARALLFCMHFCAAQQIALGQDTDDFPVAVQDRQAANAAIEHQTNGITDGRISTDRGDVPGHDIRGFHDTPLCDLRSAWLFAVSGCKSGNAR
jgi:hypothetical protein